MAQWNPWHGCKKYSAGCRNCYVYRIDARHGRDASEVHKTADFALPVKKKRDGSYKLESGTLVWTCFSSDFFLEEADAFRKEAWSFIKERSDLSFIFITKRITRFYECIPDDWGDGYDNVSIWCTCENQSAVDERLSVYLEAPIKHKCLICEPCLEYIDLKGKIDNRISYVSVGGESGENARPMNFDWILKMAEDSKVTGVPVKFRQTGANFIKDGRQYYIPRRYQHSQARKAKI